MYHLPTGLARQCSSRCYFARPSAAADQSVFASSPIFLTQVIAWLTQIAGQILLQQIAELLAESVHDDLLLLRLFQRYLLSLVVYITLYLY